MINKKFKLLRNKIDKLDYKLLNLIKSRTELVKKIIKIKKLKKDIVDKKRINSVLLTIKKNSIRKKIDPIITRKIWLSIIKSFIDYERRNFKKK